MLDQYVSRAFHHPRVVVVLARQRLRKIPGDAIKPHGELNDGEHELLGVESVLLGIFHSKVAALFPQ